jgi:hypothetical protein
MTDRAAGFLVHIEEDMRIGDGDKYWSADHIATAISMIRGVAKVEPIVADMELHMATERAKLELRKQIREIIQ